METDERGGSDSPRRSWHRLHFSTWLCIGAAAALLGLANVPGEPTDLFPDDTPDRLYEHGWPSTWLVREGSGGMGSFWALAEDVCYVEWLGLATNLLVALALLALAAMVAEWRSRRRLRVWQFTIGDLLAIVLITGLPLMVVAERRQAFASFQALAKDTRWAEGGWDVTIPRWLYELLPDTEFVGEAILSAGLLRPDRNVSFPEVQSDAAILRALLALGPDGLKVRVTKNDASIDGIELPPFDPSALRSLTPLRHLALERADDEVLACIESLPDLRSLHVYDGCLPMTPASAANLKGLKKLRSLHATRRCLGNVGVQAVSTLTTLERLSLTGASEADIALLASLKNLRFLELPETTATDAGLVPLASLSQLEQLSLSGYQVTGSGLAPLSRLRRLRTLSLWNCGLTDAGLAGLKDLDSLSALTLSYTPITGAGLSSLAKLERLSQLDLSWTEVTDDGLRSLPLLPRLEVLDLGVTRLSADSLDSVNRFEALRDLRLIGSRVTSLRALDWSRLHNLKRLDCEASWVDRGELAQLGTVRPDLQPRRHCQRFQWPFEFKMGLAEAQKRPAEDRAPIRVCLEGPEFGDADVAALHGLAPIERVWLKATRVTDVGLAALTEFDVLEDIDLTDTPIGDAGLAALGILPRLKRLDLSYTEVTAQGLAGLATFPALEVVGLDPSQVTTSVVNDLKRIPTLERLTIYRDRAPWGKQYRGAGDFDEFVALLREDLPAIEAAVKEYSGPSRYIEF